MERIVGGIVDRELVPEAVSPDAEDPVQVVASIVPGGVPAGDVGKAVPGITPSRRPSKFRASCKPRPYGRKA